jgi:hypothetical protein
MEESEMIALFFIIFSIFIIAKCISSPPRFYIPQLPVINVIGIEALTMMPNGADNVRLEREE